ncbi:hypothetical protein OC844_007525, partial [Tilletia horrida]
PKRAIVRSTADRILTEIEGGGTLPAHFAVPELRANISSVKTAANRMLPPSLPLANKAGNADASGGVAVKPIGPYARRRALNERLAKRRAEEGTAGGEGQPSLLDQVAAIRARDGMSRTRAIVRDEADEAEDVDEEMEGDEGEGKDAEPEPAPKKGRKGKGKAAREPGAEPETEAEDTAPRRTLRLRKAKTPAAAALDKASGTDEEKAAARAKAKASAATDSTSAPAPAAKKTSAPEPPKIPAAALVPAASSSAAPSGTAQSLPKIKAKEDYFQVIIDGSARAGSSVSSLRQRTEKKFRQHGKGSTGGRFGLDDEDEDRVPAEELEKIKMPQILFPTGLNYCGGDSAAPTATAPAAAASSAAPATNPPFRAAATTPAAPKAPAADPPAGLAPPTDARPVTSLFGRLGERPASPDAPATIAAAAAVPESSSPEDGQLCLAYLEHDDIPARSGGSDRCVLCRRAHASSAPPKPNFQFTAPPAGTFLFVGAQ